MRRPPPTWTALAAVLAMLALASCGSGGGTASSGATGPGSPSASLTGTLQQYREDQVAHVLQVELANTGTSPVRVESLAVSWPGLDGTSAVTPAYDVAPGARVALTVPYGQAVCTTPARPAGPVTALVGVGGREVRVDLAASEQLLASLWDEDCRRQRVLAAVGVAFGDTWRPATRAGAPVLRGSIVLTRGTSTTAVSVLSLGGSVLLTLDRTPPSATPIATLQPDDATLEVPVDVGATGTCTGHVLGESKKTYVFDVGLDLGNGSGRVGLSISPDVDVRPSMFEVVRKACGLS